MFLRLLMVAFVLVSFALSYTSVLASNSDSDNISVIQSFANQPEILGATDSFDEIRDQHKILFYMGVVLLILIFTTAGLGLAMVMKGKQVFVAHMISASATVFLALAHSVVAVVWFFPFK
ncbi:MAG: hypothetical protein OEZ58_05795 [Gammaproteobacteria bacterium]|nr:hypothetical protein [Gammaproteobacteria bacterium]MDH5728480.1 hypothetical protein [Gammaproteobacteria bacterium]